MPATHSISFDNMNSYMKVLEYAVRGPVDFRAGELEKELSKGAIKPFKEVFKANIGDGQAMGQRPISFIREVIALVTMPSLLEDSRFSEDVKRRARYILEGCLGGSVGAYSSPLGLEVIRGLVSKYIEKRDGGIPSNPDDIIITAGASGAIKKVLQIIDEPLDGKRPGVMIPIPQYPLYSVTVGEYNMHQINYYLDEDAEWGLNIEDLENSILEAKKVCAPRAIVVINPGNPTGQVLTRSNIEAIIQFAYKERLFILADEVYQDNVYAEGSQFHSFKKVLMEMGAPYSGMELASVMSCSKGYMGECGLRGGYCELINLCPKVRAMFYKTVKSAGCAPVLGQTALACVVNPPQVGEPSYKLFVKERDSVLNGLVARAQMVAHTFNSISGMRCNTVQGAMYAFPRIDIPAKAIEEANRRGVAPDVLYAFELLEETGICVVPGSGFGQKDGTHHIRVTILGQTDNLMIMLDTFKEFHTKFLKKYN